MYSNTGINLSGMSSSQSLINFDSGGSSLCSNVGTIVENCNTGLRGEIIRAGTNHLICVTEDGIMFKSWIKDVCEVQ